MKCPLRFLLLASLVAPFATLTAAADKAPADPVKPAVPELQVVIHVSPQPDPMEAEETAEVFTDILDQAFRLRGYKGEIKPLYRGDDPKPDLPLLEIRLNRWRIGPTALPECSFTGVLTQGGDMKTKLGEFSASDLIWNQGTGPSDRGEALRRVAESALRDLAHDLADKHRLPGFPPPKVKK